jgi:hypothetical protein
MLNPANPLLGAAVSELILENFDIRPTFEDAPS